MTTVDQLLSSLRLENPMGDAEIETSGQEAVVGTTDMQFYVREENETAEDFVKRLPPSQLLRLGRGDIIAIKSISFRNLDGLEDFLIRGEELLRSYEGKYLNKNKEEQETLLPEELKQKVIFLAKKKKVLEGSWLLFPATDEVDDVWLKIVESTIDGYLGINAAIDRKMSNYVIRVYTNDFTDKADVLRVLEGLNYLKLLGSGIHYECTAFSKLKIFEENLFNIDPSIYRSKDYFQLQDENNPLLYGVKEENESAENFVARLLPSKILHTKSGLISLFRKDSDVIFGQDNEGSCRAKSTGDMLLEEYKSRIESAPIPERSSIIKELENKLKNLAVECNHVKGRWMVYTRFRVDSLWLKIVEGTMNGTLGLNAKVQRKKDLYEVRVITKDFNDEADVMRVLAEIKRLGFLPPFVYKTHLYSKLRIQKRNDYGLNPHLHVVKSREGPRVWRGDVKGQSRPPLRGNR